MFKSASDCRLLIGAILTKPTKCSCTTNLHSIKLSFKSLFRITTFIYKCIYFDNQKLELTPEKKSTRKYSGNYFVLLPFHVDLIKAFFPHKLLSHTQLPVYHSASNIFFFLVYIYMGYFSYAGSSFIKTCILAPGIGNTARFPIPFVTSGFLLLVHNRHDTRRSLDL